MTSINLPSLALTLKDFCACSFDVYSTLIDESTGLYTALSPLLSRLPTTHPHSSNRTLTLSHFHDLEHSLQSSQPTLPYNILLSRAYHAFASTLSLPIPSEEETATFSNSIPSWPAFPDTVAALQTLRKAGLKLVILSNIDNASIQRTIEGPLKGVKFDLVLTAQEIGSYKPDERNFVYLAEKVRGELGVEKGRLLHVAQSLRCDMIPAGKLGFSTCFIDRECEEEKAKKLREDGEVNFAWTFRNMGDFAKAVAQETGVV